MRNNKLDLIRQYCDTTGVRLHEDEKDLLCKVLENPEYYEGFESSVFEKRDSGRDYRDTWSNSFKWQYRISLSEGTMHIYERYLLEVSDGYRNDHWNWNDAADITEIRQILDCLKTMEKDL